MKYILPTCKKKLIMYNVVTLVCGSNSVVECILAKDDVASSSLVSRSIFNKKHLMVLFICTILRRGSHYVLVTHADLQCSFLRMQILVLGLLAVRESVVSLTGTSFALLTLAKIRLAAYMILRNHRLLESSHLVSRSIKNSI